MITGELKNKIDQLWEMLWTEGNTNPLTNIEYMIERAKSQLAIQKSLEELDHQVSYVSDDVFNLKLDTIFDEYDDVFKALVEK